MVQNAYGSLAHGANFFTSAATLVSLNICLFGVAQKHFLPFFQSHTQPQGALKKEDTESHNEMACLGSPYL